jgi:bifunctional DNA-binding transcriptional regulator/antitoxin component of YhaV-PrlF toxin-antitoxin module
MPTYTAKVGPERKLTLPQDLCARLGIETGTEIEFFLTLDGQVHFHALSASAHDFAGLGSKIHTPPVSIREMDDAIADHLAEKHERIKRETRERLSKEGQSKPAAE